MQQYGHFARTAVSTIIGKGDFMAIYINEESRVFRLVTENSEYQLHADELGVLRHLWYGKKVDTDMSYLLDYPDVGFSGNPYDAGDKRTYSLNTQPLEYPCEGVGDFRVSAVSVVHSDGSNALDLRYKGHKLSKGKYSISGLPAVYADDSDAETLEIFLRDTSTETEVTLRYGVISKYDIITRSAVVKNCGYSPIKIEKAASLCLDIPHGEWEWVHFHGRHAMERLMERVPLFHGVQEISSSRGTSSHQQNPSVILCSPDCTEQNGECIGAFFMYSGGFKIQTEFEQMDQVRLVMGLDPETFEWTLENNETFETPEAVMTFSANGFAKMSHNFHKIIRENVCRGKYQLAERPVLINNWEATYFDFNEKKILKIAKSAAKLGVDMLVLDDGWFGKRNSDTSGLGDWFVNENKLKGGLSMLADKINDLGMKLGIWFEPEMVSEDSHLYRAHPDWAIAIPDRKPMRGRFQLVLDMSRREVQDYLFGAISNILDNANISYIKWDMNRSISDLYSHVLPAERQGELSHRYVLGLYSLLERLIQKYPNVLFEGCSGGGGRFDAGMLYYTPQIWCSDNSDAIDRLRIQYGTSFGYPVSAMGAHVSAVPNHQTGRITPLHTRGVVAMSGTFGYELDLLKLTEEEKDEVRSQIGEFRKYAPLIQNGRYYRLTDPFKSEVCAWEIVGNSQEEVLLNVVMEEIHGNMTVNYVQLRGLDESALYKEQTTGRIYSGAALMHGGMPLPAEFGEYRAYQYHFVRE